MRRTYSDELKQLAIGRVMAGEDVSAVARELDIGRTALQNWIAAAAPAVTAVMTVPTLREDLALFLHESLVTLTAHARLYGSAVWIERQEARTVMEATRTIGSRFTAIMDRLDGRAGEDPDE